MLRYFSNFLNVYEPDLVLLKDDIEIIKYLKEGRLVSAENCLLVLKKEFF